MNHELLEKPLPAEQLRQRQKSNIGNVPDYVEALAAIQRLNDALDSAGRFETLEHHEPTEFDEVLELGRRVSRLAQERTLSIPCLIGTGLPLMPIMNNINYPYDLSLG